MSITTHFEDRSRFCCTGGDYETADAVLFGIPFDGTASFHPGARSGPSAIRRASWGMEPYSPELKHSLLQHDICDLRDLPVYGTQEEMFRNVTQVAEQAADDAMPFVVLGGEHSIAFPLVRGVQAAAGDLAVLVIDAHLDLRDEYLGNPLSHACVVRRCLEITPHVHHFGARSGTEEEWAYAGRIHQHDELLPDTVIAELCSSDKPLYLSIDMDVLDPACAPGVGTPEPGGCSSRALLQAVHRLSPLRDRIVGCDITEVTPRLDPAGITAAGAGKIARELLLMLGP